MKRPRRDSEGRKRLEEDGAERISDADPTWDDPEWDAPPDWDEPRYDGGPY